VFACAARRGVAHLRGNLVFALGNSGRFMSRGKRGPPANTSFSLRCAGPGMTGAIKVWLPQSQEIREKFGKYRGKVKENLDKTQKKMVREIVGKSREK